MTKTVIHTDNAPAAIGTYSQAIKAGNTVYVSGQIPLDPKTMELVEGFEEQTVQVFENLKAVIEASGGYLHDVAKLNIFLTDLSHFAKVNEIMGRYFTQPYPARRSRPAEGRTGGNGRHRRPRISRMFATGPKAPSLCME